MNQTPATVTPIRPPIMDAITTVPADEMDRRCMRVLHAMMFGEFGLRVRETAQRAAQASIAGDYMGQHTRVLMLVVDDCRAHMHEVHAGVVAHQVIAELLDPDHEHGDAAGRLAAREAESG